jgi:hypothetical protein
MVVIEITFPTNPSRKTGIPGFIEETRSVLALHAHFLSSYFSEFYVGGFDHMFLLESQILEVDYPHQLDECLHVGPGVESFLII